MVVSLKANRKRILAFILLAAIVAGACFFLTGRGEEAVSYTHLAAAAAFSRAVAKSFCSFSVKRESTQSAKL